MRPTLTMGWRVRPKKIVFPITAISKVFVRKSTQVFHRLATRRMSTQVDHKSSVYASTFCDLRELANRLANLTTHPKSVRKFWFCKLASSCIDLRVRLTNFLLFTPNGNRWNLIARTDVEDTRSTGENGTMKCSCSRKTHTNILHEHSDIATQKCSFCRLKTYKIYYFLPCR